MNRADSNQRLALMGEPVEGTRMLTFLCVLGIVSVLAGIAVEQCAVPDPHEMED